MRKYSEVVKELRSTMANEKTCLVGEQIPYSHASGDWNTLEDLAIAAMMRLEDLEVGKPEWLPSNQDVP